jgi:hypothetical protein|nr:MAG TPA: hypothetical protein [Caudoviricetes sp.]
MRPDVLLDLLGIDNEDVPKLDECNNNQDCIDAISDRILKMCNLGKISITECLNWLFLYNPWELSFPGLKYTKLKQQWLAGELTDIPDEEALLKYQQGKVKEFRRVLKGLLILLKEGIYKLDKPFHEKLFLNDKESIKLEKLDYYTWLLEACIRNQYHSYSLYGLPNPNRKGRDYMVSLLVEYLKNNPIFRKEIEENRSVKSCSVCKTG